MKTLCILIPTYNHPMHVKEWLDKSICHIEKNDIDVHLYDSSNNNKTQDICDEFNNERIIYHKCVSNDSTPDKKVFDAFSELTKLYEYIWLCGDGALINFDEAYDKFENVKNEKVDIIHFCDNTLNINKIVDCNTGRIMPPPEFVSRFIHSFTLYGASIFSAVIITKLLDEVDIKRYAGSGFYPQFAVLNVLNDETKIFVCTGYFYKSSDAKVASGSGCMQPNSFFPIWVASWARCTEDLPEYYNSVKEAIMHTPSRAYFSIKGLMGLRVSGNLSFSIIKKYKSDLKKTLHRSIVGLYFIAVVPKWILKFAKKLYKLIFRRKQNS